VSCDRSELQPRAVDGLDIDRIVRDTSSGGSDCNDCILIGCVRENVVKVTCSDATCTCLQLA
jgi:hypothetical protein